MLIAKTINHPVRGLLNIHVIDSVDFVLVHDVPVWRGYYRSFGTLDDYLSEDQAHADSGRISGIGLTELNGNPVTAFTQAAVDSERSPFHGGSLLDQTTTVLNALEMYKAQQWEIVKYSRDQALTNGVNTPYGKFNTDVTSLVNMLGAVSVGEAQGPTWSTPWIKFDNTPTTLTVPQLRHIGALVASWRGSCYTQGATLRAILESANSKETIRSVVWTDPSV